MLNKLQTIEDPMVAEIVAVDLYNLAYGLETQHPWSACQMVYPDLYHEQLSRFLSLYKDINVASFGISFESFMGMTQESILTIVKACSGSTKPKSLG